MSYSKSKTRTLTKVKEYETFTRVQYICWYTAPYSSVLPRTWPDWVAHRLAFKKDADVKELRRFGSKVVDKRSKNAVKPILAGKRFNDSRTAVLAMESIWLPWGLEPMRKQASWPSIAEFVHEGTRRTRSGYKCFLPLPRVPGNETVCWQQWTPVVAFQLDKIGHPTWAENPAIQIEDEMFALIGDALLNELNQ